VVIDEASLKAQGQWPWPRTVVAELVNQLTANGAAAIGFDMVFANPDRLSPHAIAKRIHVDGNFSNNGATCKFNL
jgi:adenylate cyclase